jgi:hypothetical protein
MAQKQIAPTTQTIKTPIKTESIATPLYWYGKRWCAILDGSKVRFGSTCASLNRRDGQTCDHLSGY